jgi:hypothetical protein
MNSHAMGRSNGVAPQAAFAGACHGACNGVFNDVYKGAPRFAAENLISFTETS